MKRRMKNFKVLLTLALAVSTTVGGIVLPLAPVAAEAAGYTREAEPTGSYDDWKSGQAYKLGDLVAYKEKVYECTFAHTSHGGWLPDETFTLWKERPDLVNEAKPPVEGGGEEGGEDNNYYVNEALPQHMVTGYWHNFVNGSTNLKLSDVPKCYDMICVAFTGNTTTPGEVTFTLDDDLCEALGGYTKAEFIQDIKDLKEKGQHVIISVGGAEGRIDINSEAAADLFATGLIDIIEEYGFEGVDIDLEGSAVQGVDYIAGALRKVHDHFGKDFIITMAPETFYIQADRLSYNDITTAYLRLALEIKDILTICYPQFYNSGGMNGYGGSVVSPGNADFITSLATLILEAGLRPDQVALGVPSTTQAGGNYVTPAVVTTAVNALVNKTSSGSFTAPNAYPALRGVMTWSINWDATNNYEWGKSMAALMDTLPIVDNGGNGGDETEETTEATTEETTEETEETTEETTEAVATGTWDASKVYYGGDTVTYNGKEYRAQWWTQGEKPSVSSVWVLIGDATDETDEENGSTEESGENPDIDGIPKWSASEVYNGGAKVVYDGKVYKARWWTQGTVPSDTPWGVWQLVK